MKKRAPLLEIILCLGPMFVFWPLALVLIPHQLMLAFRDGYWNALWTVVWYLGTFALAVAVRAMYVYIRDEGRRPFSTLVVQLCLIFGLISIVIGPAGSLAVGGSSSLKGLVFCVLLPLVCVIRLIARAKRYILAVQ